MHMIVCEQFAQSGSYIIVKGLGVKLIHDLSIAHHQATQNSLYQPTIHSFVDYAQKKEKKHQRIQDKSSEMTKK